MASWVPYRKGCDLPAHAIKASEHYKADGGPLYIGKSIEGDVGKINVDNGNLHNLWISGQRLKIQVFPWTEGGILTCDPRLIEWKEFTKGRPLPSLAFHAGNMPRDGDIYVGKNVAGEVGKINVDGKNMHHLWCATSGCSMSGYILCIHDDPNWASLSGANRNRGPASGGTFYGGTLCPSSDNGQHRFDRVSYKGQVAVDATAKSKHEQSQDQSLNLDVSGSASQGAKSSAQKATKSETEAGGGVSCMGTGVNAYGKKSNEDSAAASAEVEQRTTADAGLGMTNRSEQKSEDLAKAGGAIVGDTAVSYVCLNCGQQIMCTPTDNAGKIVPHS